VADVANHDLSCAIAFRADTAETKIVDFSYNREAASPEVSCVYAYFRCC
jgi:hypothetical protein